MIQQISTSATDTAAHFGMSAPCPKSVPTFKGRTAGIALGYNAGLPVATQDAVKDVRAWSPPDPG